MNRVVVSMFLATAILVFAITAGCGEGLDLRAEKDATGLAIYVGDTLFTHYRTADDWKYPYFYPVNGPASGESVTTETSEPYPHHHSLFFGCDRVNGGNYWQDTLERGQILSKKLDIAKAKGKEIVFEEECRWERPGAEPPFKDARRIVVSAPSKDIRLIDFSITMTALMDVRIEKTNHSLFSARMRPEMSVKSGGTLINAEGLTSEKGTFGQKSSWCDYSNKRNGVVEGLAILSHPSNKWHPEPWFTRDYGFFSPTPMYWLENDELKLAKGDKLSFRYLTVVHTGDSKEADIEGIYQRWSKK